MKNPAHRFEAVEKKNSASGSMCRHFRHKTNKKYFFSLLYMYTKAFQTVFDHSYLFTQKKFLNLGITLKPQRWSNPLIGISLFASSTFLYQFKYTTNNV